MPSLRMRDEKPSVIETPEAAPAPVAPKPSEASVATKRPSWLQSHGTTLLLMALLSVPAYFVASRFIVTAVVIQGRSMMPALKDGEHYYLNRWQYLLMSPKRGDIVVIKDPGHTDFAVKRIVATANRRGQHPARVAFLAMDPKGNVGAAATQGTKFEFAVARGEKVEMLKAKEM